MDDVKSIFYMSNLFLYHNSILIFETNNYYYIYYIFWNIRTYTKNVINSHIWKKNICQINLIIMQSIIFLAENIPKYENFDTWELRTIIVYCFLPKKYYTNELSFWLLFCYVIDDNRYDKVFWENFTKIDSGYYHRWRCSVWKSKILDFPSGVRFFRFFCLNSI